MISLRTILFSKRSSETASVICFTGRLKRRTGRSSGTEFIGAYKINLNTASRPGASLVLTVAAVRTVYRARCARRYRYHTGTGTALTGIPLTRFASLDGEKGKRGLNYGKMT